MTPKAALIVEELRVRGHCKASLGLIADVLDSCGGFIVHGRELRLVSDSLAVIARDSNLREDQKELIGSVQKLLASRAKDFTL